MKTPTEILLALFEKNKGYLLSKELRRNSALYSALRVLIDTNCIEKVKPGLYRHITMAHQNEWQEVCHIYPQGVFCMYSAWHYYELTTGIPHTYYLAFPNKAKITLQDYPPIQAFYWSNHLYNLQIIQLDGFRMYSLEKSVCDAIKFRNKIGKDTMVEVLKNYLKRKDKNLNELFRIAKIMKMENLLREYLNLMQ
jgi:predicted transcriptional regulator of viral defense system